MSQGQFHKAFAVAQGDRILAGPGAQRLGCTPHDDDNGIASPVLRKQVVYGVPVHRADAWEEEKTHCRGCSWGHCLPPTVMYKQDLGSRSNLVSSKLHGPI